MPLSPYVLKLTTTKVGVLIAESIGHSFGTLLFNGLWNLNKPYIIPVCKPLG